MGNQAKTPRRPSTVLVGALAGALAGLTGGFLDGLWSFPLLGQYLPSLLGKLGLLLHLGLSYALAGTFVGASLGLLGQRLSATVAPQIWSAVSAREPATSSRLMRTRLPLAIASAPALAIATAVSYQGAYHDLAFRKHSGLIIAVSIGITLIAFSLWVIATLLLAEVAERLLKRLGVRSVASLARTMSVSLLLVSLCSALGYFYWREHVARPSLSPPWIALPALLSPILVGYLVSHWMFRPKRAPLPLALPLVLCGMPLLGIFLSATFVLSGRMTSAPHPLLIASTMSMTLLSISLSSALTFALGMRLAAPLQRFQSPRAPWIAGLLILSIAATVGVLASWKTLSLLPLRPGIVSLLLAVLALSILPWARRWASHIPGWTALATVPLLFVGLILSGQSEAVQKAQKQYSGLSEPLARIYRQAGDWDRDGSSRWLGGGDCDDSNPRVNPNAEEIPFDGIDNNCLRGDVSERSARATHFAALPEKLPAGFNILFLTIDTLRADHLGAYGYRRDTSPNIDAIAAEGTLFQNAWAHAPSTRYSIPALLTGRYPLNVDYEPLPGQWPGLSMDNTTIAEIARARGLYTGGILNYWYFDARRHMNQGFDYYNNDNRRLHKAVTGKGPAKTSGSSSREQSDSAIAFVAKHQRERFFLWVHYYDPHYDYEKHPGTKSFGDTKIDSYDHEISFTDQQIGRLIDDLKARGLYEKTVIVITGDHGEGFGEHGINLHGYHLYAAQTKVPLIIKVPGSHPSVVTMPASHVDVLPTLANLLGAKSTSEMMGRSLVGLITGKEDRDQDRYVFQQLSFENNNEYRGAVSKHCHVLYNISPNRSWELYRVDIDPMEERDIIDTPGQCSDARLALETWYDYSQVPRGATEALLSKRPTLSGPTPVTFGSSIKLLSVTIPKKVRRGESASMQLTWSALERPPKGWKVFAHFEMNPSEKPKRCRFTADHRPARPFSWWQEGQYIRYTHRFAVPPHQSAGHYDLWFGLYKGSDRMRPETAEFQVVERRVKIGSIEVLQ